MSTPKKPSETDRLSLSIDYCYDMMDSLEESTEDYAKVVDQLTKLHKLKMNETSSNRVSKDTLAIVGANLLGILLVLNHEKTNVITSKAFGLVTKIR